MTLTKEYIKANAEAIIAEIEEKLIDWCEVDICDETGEPFAECGIRVSGDELCLWTLNDKGVQYCDNTLGVVNGKMFVLIGEDENETELYIDDLLGINLKDMIKEAEEAALEEWRDSDDPMTSAEFYRMTCQW